MKVSRTVQFESQSGHVLTNVTKDNHVLLVGSIHRIDSLEDDILKFIGGGLAGDAKSTEVISNYRDFDGVNAYKVAQLLKLIMADTSSTTDVCEILDVLIDKLGWDRLNKLLSEKMPPRRVVQSEVLLNE